MEINHPCFADDLIFFDKGDYKSVDMILQAVELFVATTRLKENKSKLTLACLVVGLSIRRFIGYVITQVSLSMAVWLLNIWESQSLQENSMLLILRN